MRYAVADGFTADGDRRRSSRCSRTSSRWAPRRSPRARTRSSSSTSTSTSPTGSSTITSPTLVIGASRTAGSTSAHSHAVAAAISGATSASPAGRAPRDPGDRRARSPRCCISTPARRMSRADGHPPLPDEVAGPLGEVRQAGIAEFYVNLLGLGRRGDPHRLLPDADAVPAECSTRRPASSTAAPSPRCSTRSWCRRSERLRPRCPLLDRRHARAVPVGADRRGRDRRGLGREARTHRRVLRGRGGRRDERQADRPQRADLQREPGQRSGRPRRPDTPSPRPAAAAARWLPLDRWSSTEPHTGSRSPNPRRRRCCATYGVPIGGRARGRHGGRGSVAAAEASSATRWSSSCAATRSPTRPSAASSGCGSPMPTRSMRRPTELLGAGDAGRRPGDRPRRADGRGQPRADRRRGARPAVRRERDARRRRHPGRGDRRCRVPARADQRASMPTR